MRQYYASKESWPPPHITDHLRKVEHQRMLSDSKHEYQERTTERLVAEWRFVMADAMIAEDEEFAKGAEGK